MKKLYFRLMGIACFLFLITSCISRKDRLQSGFVYAQEKIPGLVLDLRYFGAHNFTGRTVAGYERPVLILSRKAVHALKKVQKDLRKKGLALKVFDAYRPQRAVSSFEAWARDANDTIAKAEFYPDVDKHDLFRLGYLAAKSGHTRGSTVDLTLIDIQTGKELDMGSPFDLFGEISHQNTAKITELQKKNRQILRQAMLEHHFKDYHEEWWHFTLIDEPFPDTYFDFPVN
ncbi:M15 family metallopeptidase [Chryseobacterium kwangjuense]|uniref:D-alanyl-D-alanine dipeptidase n=1 Tax=Chryseobacterium kwangjuense TaxID=267125 RepID=A0A135W417_9FLAO|nr:M15 family metallopeptidase [Chryseobacterium kwangjuense]KXH79674.1 peptidase M15 [Chryseobacterium kwangjuense]